MRRLPQPSAVQADMSTIELYPYQRIGAERIAAQRLMLLADEMGLGKTVQAIYGFRSAVMSRDARFLVICPAHLKVNWANELCTFAPGDTVEVLSGRGADVPNGVNWTVLNYDLVTASGMCEKLLASGRFSGIVVDESHYMKSRDAGRTKALLGSKASGRPAVPGVLSLSRRRLLMSGTPAPNNQPRELYTQLVAVSPVFAKMSYRQFTNRYCAAHLDRYGRVDDSGSSNMQEFRREISGLLLRRTKSEVLTELPPKQHDVVVLPPCGGKAVIEERKVYESTLASRGFRSSEEDTHMETLRREVGMARVPYSAHYIEGVLQEEKAVVFAWSQDVIDELTRRLKHYGARAVTGKTPQHRRQENVEAFLRSKEPGLQSYSDEYSCRRNGV